MSVRLELVSKSFGATRAVDGVSLDIPPGRILAIAGENGAGKTTLMRILAGELAPDSGSVVREGRVELVHQHFMLVDDLTIAENLALTAGTTFRFATRGTLEAEALETIARSGIALSDPRRKVAELSVGERSKLELIKAIARRPSTLVLDEPTSVLTPAESEELFRVMRELAAEGTAVVFISHKLPEVLAVAERIVVMRAGRVVAETGARDMSAQSLAEAMVGRRELQEASALPHEHHAHAAVRHGDLVAHGGEIVAIVGVAGNGQSELAAELRDAFPEAGHIPEDRTRDGIIGEMTIAENLALRSRRWHARSAARHAKQLMALYSVRARGPLQRAGDLSGGNQQKVILARELDRRPHVIVAAEPTRGLDIEASAFVHNQLRVAASAGAAIVLITSDLDEAFALADAVHVIYRGRLSERLSREEAPSRVPALMAGVA